MRILYLDLDTLRPDHLGCYGYQRDTSPNIDAIAREGTLYTNYYCSDAPCLPSRAACFGGRFGIHNGAINHGGFRADMYQDGAGRQFQDRLAHACLPGFLKDQGFHTVSVSPFAERHSAWTFYAGFSEMYNTGKGGMESAEDVSPAALAWLDRQGREDHWFLHINYWDAHAPYRAPEAFGNPFAEAPLDNWITPAVLAQHRAAVGPHSAQELEMYENRYDPRYPRQPAEIQDMAILKQVFDGYDCGIQYMDQHVGAIINKLKALGIYEDTAIIVSADHGENMGELGIYCEHATADEPTCHIPMIIKWPGGQQGHHDDGLHYNLDLLPSLAQALGADAGSVAECWDGESYAPSFLSGEDTGRPYLVLSQCTHVVQRSVRFQDYLWIKTWHDGHHLFPDEMLFNLRADPHEQTDLAAASRELCYYAAYQYQQWLDQMMLSAERDVDPMWTVLKTGGPYHADGDLAAYYARLESTGRAEAAARLRARYRSR